VVFILVSLIQVLSFITGETIAFKAKPGFASLEHFALFNPAIPSTNRFAVVRTPASRAPVPLPEVCHADTAVYSAWSNQ